MGHMTKSSRTFCTVLKSHPDVLDQLRQCCFEEDSHVRKMAFFVLGNFISTNEILYEYVDELTPFLVQALNDTISKIRSHAVSKFHPVIFILFDIDAFLIHYRYLGLFGTLSSLRSID